MGTIGNILWHFPFFGFVTAGLTWILGLLFTITGVLAPLGNGLREMANFYMAPFSKKLVNEKMLPDYNPEEKNKAWAAYKGISKILWVVVFGWWLFIASVFQGIALCISIIGIPVGLVVLKNATSLFNPIGKKCVSNELHQAIMMNNAQTELNKMQSA